MSEVLDGRRPAVDNLALAGISRITPQRYLPVQQVFQHLRVVRSGRYGKHQVNLSGFAVHADMGLDSKVPLLALARILLTMRILYCRDQDLIRVALILNILGDI